MTDKDQKTLKACLKRLRKNAAAIVKLSESGLKGTFEKSESEKLSRLEEAMYDDRIEIETIFFG